MGEDCWSWGGLDTCVVSGGYGYGYVGRKNTVQDDRERLGIIPKSVKKIIKAVVKETIEELESEAEAKDELKTILAKKDLSYKIEYGLALEQYRSKMIELRIGQLIRAKILKEEKEDDDEAIRYLLM